MCIDLRRRPWSFPRSNDKGKPIGPFPLSFSPRPLRPQRAECSLGKPSQAGALRRTDRAGSCGLPRIRDYFFLLFGFFTSFFAPCREAAMPHHLLFAKVSDYSRIRFWSG